MLFYNLFNIIKLYDNIDTMPIHNWLKINETNDLRWLIVDDKKRTKFVQNDTHKLAWQNILDQVIDEFGIPEKMMELAELKRDIDMLRADLVVKKKAVNETIINIKINRIHELLAETQEKYKHNSLAFLQSKMPFYIDAKKVSVKEFYTWFNYEIDKIKQEAKHGR